MYGKNKKNTENICFMRFWSIFSFTPLLFWSIWRFGPGFHSKTGAPSKKCMKFMKKTSESEFFYFSRTSFYLKRYYLNFQTKRSCLTVLINFSNHYRTNFRFEHFLSGSGAEIIKWVQITSKYDFVTVFNSLVLRAQLELDKKLGHYDYLLLAKRWFPGSFVL